MENEIWINAKGFEDTHEVSSFGRIKNKKKDIILKGNLINSGYLTVSIRGKSKLIHRIVAESFLGESELQVDHIDGVKTNNCVSNLQYLNNRINNLKSRQNKTGFKGVYKNGRFFYSNIQFNKRIYIIAKCDTAEAASKIYYKAVEEIDNNEFIPEKYENALKRRSKTKY